MEFICVEVLDIIEFSNMDFSSCLNNAIEYTAISIPEPAIDLSEISVIEYMDDDVL
jgi:hypothetical protein